MENNHWPRYSLPPQSIVGGRYLVQDFLEEQENQLIYLAYDLVEKKQVRLAEYYPKALVRRNGEAGEEDVTIRPRRDARVEEIQRRFEKKHKQVIKDHHTVYAVLPLNKKKPMGAIALCMAVIVLGAGMLFYTLRPAGQQHAKETQEISEAAVSETSSENMSRETVTYDNGDYIYQAGADTIQMDADSGIIYYDRILQVYLESKLTDEQLDDLTAVIDGKLVGKIAGRMNILQVQIPESGFDALEEAAQKLMEQENVLFSGYDYPVHIDNTMVGQDTNPWSEAAGEDGKAYNEDEPSGNNWWAEAIGAYTAWNNLPEKMDNGIMGIIDNEFDINHPDLKGKIRIIGNEENSKMRMKRVERKTLMVLTAGLFKRFKCLLTSSFCLEAPSLVAEDSEIRRPQEHKTTTKYLQYRCFPPISPNPPEVACEAMCWCSKLKYCDSRG